MRRFELAILSFGLFAASSAGLAQDAQKQPCPAGEATTAGGCVQDMPATPHQQEVLKGAATQEGQPAATGEATGTTTGTPAMPETKHQQEVLKKSTDG